MALYSLQHDSTNNLEESVTFTLSLSKPHKRTKNQSELFPQCHGTIDSHTISECPGCENLLTLVAHGRGIES